MIVYRYDQLVVPPELEYSIVENHSNGGALRFVSNGYIGLEEVGDLVLEELPPSVFIQLEHPIDNYDTVDKIKLIVEDSTTEIIITYVFFTRSLPTTHDPTLFVQYLKQELSTYLLRNIKSKFHTEFELEFTFYLIFKGNIQEGETVGESMKRALDVIDEALVKVNDRLATENQSNYLRISIPNSLITPMKQYLSFFEDYTYYVKGHRINIELLSGNDFIDLKLVYDSVEVEKVERWFFDFLYFIKGNIEELKIKFSDEIPAIKRTILREYIMNQIGFLKSNIDFVKTIKEQDVLNSSTYLQLDSVNTDKDRLKDMLRENDLSSLFRELNKKWSYSKRVVNEVILLQNRFERTNSDFARGLISNKEKSVELNKIVMGISNLIDTYM